MIRLSRTRATALSFGWLLTLLVGCGGGSDNATAAGRTKIRGRIEKNGAPLEINMNGLPPGDPGMQVIFIKQEDPPIEIPARVINAKSGTFELNGLDGKGVPPGKYRVAIILAPSGSADRLKGKYDRKNTKIEKDITGTEDTVVIDIEKPNG